MISMRLFTASLCLVLASCGNERPTQYGFGFTLLCKPTRFASWTTDKNGVSRDFHIGWITYVFVPYGGGMWIDGKHVPMQFSEDCTILRGLATESNGFDIKGIND